MPDKSLTEQIAGLFTDEIIISFWTHEKCPPSQQELKQCQLDSTIKHERCMPCWEEWVGLLTDKVLSLLRSLTNKDLLLKEKDLEEPDEEIPITHYPYGSEAVSRLYLFRLAKEQGFLEAQLAKASVKIKALEEENRTIREVLKLTENELDRHNGYYGNEEALCISCLSNETGGLGIVHESWCAIQRARQALKSGKLE